MAPHGKEVALSRELPQFRSWSADHLDLEVAAENSHGAFLLPCCFCIHVPSTGFFPEASGSQASISQPEAEWTEAQAPGLRSPPELQGFSHLRCAGWCPPRQPFSDSRSQRPKASHKPCPCVLGVCCGSYTQGCTSNRVRLKCVGILIPWTLCLGRTCPLTKGITLGGAGGTLAAGDCPPRAGVSGRAASIVHPPCTPAPFMWGCYVGQPFPLRQCPSPLPTCLGQEEPVCLEKQMQCVSPSAWPPLPKALCRAKPTGPRTLLRPLKPSLEASPQEASLLCY